LLFQIKNADYILCVVVGIGDKKKVLDSKGMTAAEGDFVYHRSDLRTDNYKYCKNFYRKATKGICICYKLLPFISINVHVIIQYIILYTDHFSSQLIRSQIK